MLQEEQNETDIPLTPAGLNFQLALFQNQMAQIQMMQAANATAMLNMGATGLQTGLGGVLNPGVLNMINIMIEINLNCDDLTFEPVTLCHIAGCLI